MPTKRAKETEKPEFTITVLKPQKRVGDMYKKLFEGFGLTMTVKVVVRGNLARYPKIRDGVCVYEGFYEIEDLVKDIEKVLG